LDTTRVLALCGVHVVMAVRNVKNGLNIKQTLLKEIPNAKIDVFKLDLSSLASDRKFVVASGFPLNIIM
jgi:WW domain-containing oxidoreductase